ncbi:MAG TPA: hypothetical protein VHS79_14700, partial [Actinomycetes bacterium]|nr:hypothetical protein [Actinomycetes bacterium]
MSQQQRPAWTGGSDEALVPLGRGDDSAPTTEHDGAQAPHRARPATEHVPADRHPDRHPPIAQRERADHELPPGRGQPPPRASRDLVDGRRDRA